MLPGKGGQKFLERCVPKVAELRERFPEKDIEVDGGVGPATVGVCAEAGISNSRAAMIKIIDISPCFFFCR